MVSITQESLPNEEAANFEADPVVVSDEEFAQLLQPESRAKLTRLAASVIKDYHEAEDAVQEAYLRAHRHRHQFQGRSTLQTWMYRITVNTAIDSRKRRAQRLGQAAFIPDLSSDDGPEFDIKAEHVDVENEVEANDLLHEVRQKMGQLSKAVRVVIELAAQGFTHQEISQRLNISESASKVRLMRGRDKLRELLQADNV